MVSSGILHTGFDAAPNTQEASLIQQSQALFGAFAEHNALPVKRNGAIMIAQNFVEVFHFFFSTSSLFFFS